MATPSRPEFGHLPEFSPLDFSLESLEIEQFNIDPPEEVEGKFAALSSTSTNCCTDNCTIHCSDPCGTEGGCGPSSACTSSTCSPTAFPLCGGTSGCTAGNTCSC
jgi:hypothetical protein